MKSICQLTAVLIVAALAGGCTPEQDPDNKSGFGHGSLRPECRYSVEPERAAYAPEPQVLPGKGWSEPVMVAAPLTDSCPNDAVEISRDGETIYFFWSPVVNGTNEELLHIHTGTYRAEKIGEDPGVFSEPRFFDLQKGSNGSIDGKPSFTPDGDFVYFHSTRADNLGYQASPATNDYLDIYVAPVTDGEPGRAVNLGEPVNSVHLDGEHTLHPDGSRLFLSSDRPGGLGEVDIWVSDKQMDGSWGEPVNVGAPINTNGWEGQPGFAADEPDTIYFVSDRNGPASIFRSTHDGLSWSEPEMVITGYVGEPALVADGSIIIIIYFVHVLVDEQGVFGSNIWYALRN